MELEVQTPRPMAPALVRTMLEAAGSYPEVKLITAVSRYKGEDGQYHENMAGPSGTFSHFTDDGDYVVLDGHNGDLGHFVVKVNDILAITVGLGYVRVAPKVRYMTADEDRAQYGPVENLS